MNTVELAIDELQVGMPLPHDIIDPEGRVLLREGHLLLPHTVERWREQGFTKVLIAAPVQDEPAVEPEPQLTRGYDEALVKEVHQVINQAQSALGELVFELAVRAEPKLELLQTITEQLSHAIAVDVDVVAAEANRHFAHRTSSRNAALLSRSVTLATMASTTAGNLGMTSADCLTVAIAGALHDVSLYEETLAMYLADRPTNEQRQEAMVRHPQRSADLLASCRDVSEQVRVVITQVHEQIDGTGFPRGIGGHLMSTHARLLNLLDAYLTLTDPNRRQAYVPADALAYLAGQTARGAFDLDCMRALLKTLSVYSVGTRVMLEDRTPATILRSSRSDPLRPIVRLDGPEQKILDLRNSETWIQAPAVDPELPGRRRLLRTELNTVLWQPLL